MAGKGFRDELDPPIPLQGGRLIQRVQHALGRLHIAGTQRDRAGNRRLFCDQYLSLLLLYFFNPSIKGLRALQNTTNWEKTRQKLGIRRTSLGSLSEASSVFDAGLVRPIIAELAAQALPLKRGREAEALKGLTAVDGSVFAALPRMAWALWEDATHRGAKLHLHFDVLKGVPCDATLTPAACSEPAELARTLQPGRLYVLDRGYASYELFAQIVQAKSSLVGRVKDSTVFVPLEERPLDGAARKAGVIRDVVISRLGTSHHKNHLRRPMRLVIVRVTNRDGKITELWLLTDRLDLPADLVALAYRYRWTVELFFRWMKSVLGARHLISKKQNGVTLQMYAAMIVSLLIILYTGAKPTVRTFETLQFYLLGWVTDQELEDHLATLQKKSR
jgi:Transposase DDE domain